MITRVWQRPLMVSSCGLVPRDRRSTLRKILAGIRRTAAVLAVHVLRNVTSALLVDVAAQQTLPS